MMVDVAEVRALGGHRVADLDPDGLYARVSGKPIRR